MFVEGGGAVPWHNGTMASPSLCSLHTFPFMATRHFIPRYYRRNFTTHLTHVGRRLMFANSNYVVTCTSTYIHYSRTIWWVGIDEASGTLSIIKKNSFPIFRFRFFLLNICFPFFSVSLLGYPDPIWDVVIQKLEHFFVNALHRSLVKPRWKQNYKILLYGRMFFFFISAYLLHMSLFCKHWRVVFFINFIHQTVDKYNETNTGK